MSSVTLLAANEGRDDWYAVYVRHQHEKIVAQSLLTRGLETFLPLYDVVHQWKDRKKHLSLPLFPCYVFMRRGLECQLGRAVSVPGVCKIVGSGGHPAPIPGAEIEAIRKTLNSSFRVEPHLFLRCGDRVRVRTGPLANIEGILLRKKNTCRLVLSATLLERSIAVEVDECSVERVGGEVTPAPTPVKRH
jgi:transcription antitermination factor NusG